MNTAEMLAELQKKALHDNSIKEQFLKTRNTEFPLKEFCEVCRELGYEIYPMDIIAASEETYAAMKRSTNGGGENSPKLTGEDDLFEDFFAGLD
ncbi:MAG: hypothetical protein IKF90_00145 [Parasporobacterium sp.]|nr:hypothetical protein [Parasporobacterium sp.]